MLCLHWSWQEHSETLDVPELDSKAWADWQNHSIKVRGDMGMSPDLHPWTSTARMLGVPRTPRYIDMIEVGYFAWLRKQRLRDDVPAKPMWVVDISQSVERRPWGETSNMLGQSSMPYCFWLDRILDGEDPTQESMVSSFPKISLGPLFIFWSRRFPNACCTSAVFANRTDCA